MSGSMSHASESVPPTIIRQVSIGTDGSPDDLVELLDWFRHDDALRGRVRPQSPQIREGQMGGLYDVLVVAVGAGGIATALTRSLTVWLINRRSDITLTVTSPDGVKVDLDAKRVKSSDVLKDIQKLFDTPDNLQ
ncbi:effector-associated constant component EACC1 [Nocardia colli]|uniref:effector-associated constant component EACC1 n=1 Tax=Nocardia colli TaxID=2545717 RepID=UPI0035D580E3